MTIKNLNKIIKDEHPNVFKKVPIKNLRGLKIAIDTSIIIHKYIYNKGTMSRIFENSDLINDGVDESYLISVVLNSFKDLLMKFMNNGIFPVFIFDGPYHPLKGKNEGSKRQADRAIAKNNLDEFLTYIKSLDTLSQGSNLPKLKELYKKSYRPSKLFYNTLKEFLEKCGVPCVQAVHDADDVLGYLSRNGLVDIIYSNDSDMYVHGCPFIIKEFNKDYKGKDGQTCMIVSMEELLTSFNMTQENFTDLCIMFGCDYNSNIKGVGEKGCIKAIDTYGCVSNLPNDKYDITILNYPECIEIFNSHKRKFSDICKNPDDSLLIDFKIFSTGNNSDLETLCVQYDIQYLPDKLKFFYKSYGEDTTLDYTEDPRHNHVFKLGIITLNCGNMNISYEKNISYPTSFVLPELNILTPPTFTPLQNFTIPSIVSTQVNIQPNFVVPSILSTPVNTQPNFIVPSILSTPVNTQHNFTVPSIVSTQVNTQSNFVVPSYNTVNIQHNFTVPSIVSTQVNTPPQINIDFSKLSFTAP